LIFEAITSQIIILLVFGKSLRDCPGDFRINYQELSRILLTRSRKSLNYWNIQQSIAVAVKQLVVMEESSRRAIMYRDRISVSKRNYNNNLRSGKRAMKRTLLALAAGTVCEMLVSHSAQGATYEWTTESGTNSWSVGSNWLGGTAPTSGSSTVIDIFDPANTLGPAGGTNVVSNVDSGLTPSSDFNIATLNLDGTTTSSGGTATVTIGGTNELEFAGSAAQINMNANYGVTAATGAGTTYDVTDALDFNVATTITFNSTASGNLNFNDELDGSGALNIQDNTYGVSGADRPVLINGGASASTYTGNVTVAAGVLELANHSSLLGANTAGTQTVTVNSGASLVLANLDGAYTDNQILVLNGAGTGVASTLGVDAALDVDSVEYGSGQIGPIVVNTNSTIRVDQNTASGHPQNGADWGVYVGNATAGTLAGTGTLTKVGTGELYLASTAANAVNGSAAFTGNVVINGGVIVGVSSSNVLGTNPGTQTVTVNSGGDYMAWAQYGATGTISQNFVLNGTGTGHVQAYTGTTPVTGLSFGEDSALSFDHEIYGNWAVTGNVTIGSGGATIRVNTPSTDQSQYGVAVSGALEGSGNLNVIGSTGDEYYLAYNGEEAEGGGYMEFDTAANGYTGNINIMGNSVVATGHVSDALGTGTNTVTVSAGAAMVLNPGNSHYDNPQNFVINGAGTGAAALHLGSDAALDLYDVDYNNETIGALNVASASTIRVNTDTSAVPGFGLQVNGALTGSSTLTVVGGNGAEFETNQYANGGNPISQNAGLLEFVATGTFSGNVVVANTTADNNDAGGTILATGPVSNALGPNTGNTQTVTIQNGNTMLLNEGNGAYATPQNIILNGAGQGETGLQPIAVGGDSALEVYEVNYGDASVGGLDIQTSSTIRINTHTSPMYPNLGLTVNGPLAGPSTSTLTIVGSTGDGIQFGTATPTTEGYGTLILTQAAGAVGGSSTGDTAFAGNVVVGNGAGSGPVLELEATNALGTGSTQKVTVDSGSAVVVNGSYSSPQSFIINGTGSGDATSGAVGNNSALQGVGATSANATIGGLSVASAATVSASSPLYGLTVNTGLAGTGNLNVIGGGTLILSSGAAASSVTGYGSYSGNVTVTSTTLDVSNASGSATGTGSVTLTGGTLISDAGSISGNVSADATSVIAPGGIGTIGHLTLGGLSTVSGATLDFDLGAAAATVTTGDLLTLGSGTISIASGTLLAPFGGATPVAGDDYRLIGGTLTGVAANLTLPTAPAGLTYSLSSNGVDPGFIDLVVGSSVINLTWNNTGGSGDGSHWDTSNQNWNNGTAPALYSSGANVTFNDTNNSHYSVLLNTSVSPASVAVNNSLGSYSITGTGGITGTTALTKMGTGTLSLSTSNSYTGGTTVSAGLLIINPTSTPATTSALPKGALTISGTAKVRLATGVTAGSQSANPPVTKPTSSVNITSLSIGASAALDITNNHIIVDYSGLSTDPIIGSIAAWIASGYASGAWTGAGIDSSTAASNHLSYGIGYAASSDAGNPAGLSSGQIEIKYTLLGDTNLDGKVNGTDFTVLATNFNQSGKAWDQGDFNYDGKVNGSDFLLLAANFNQSAGQSAVAGDDLAAVDTFAAENGLSLTSVPEPTSMGLLTVGLVGVLARRRRRSV
jgi:autotransporter-associated beta strand protein